MVCKQMILLVQTCHTRVYPGLRDHESSPSKCLLIFVHIAAYLVGDV